VSGTARSGYLLTASTGAWTGTAPISYSYQWQRDSGTSHAWVAISGATSSTYTLGSGDAGYEVRVLVVASNAYGTT
jgi:hypothetical protein